MNKKATLALIAALAVTPILASGATAAPSEPIVMQNAATVQTTVPMATPFHALAPKQPVKGQVVHFTLEAKRAKMEINGEVREVWTFNQQVPAPTLRVHQGDTVRFTLVNTDPEMEHGLDFHAGQMDMGKYHKAIKPGESVTFDWKANYPGVFYYHCSAAPVDMHIANGMFGAVIVDPPGYKPVGKEYVLIQHEWYKDSATNLDVLRSGEEPEAMAFNGTPARYMDDPLTAAAGENVRFYFVNAGINKFSAFHVIGTIFDKVLLDGNPANTLRGVQTVAVPPGGALTADLAADKGVYAILTHSLKDAFKGAIGVLSVGDAPAGDAAHSHGGGGTSDGTSGGSDSDSGSHDQDHAASGNQVGMKNFAFTAPNLTVNKGDTVTWTNEEASLHTIVGDTFDSRTEKQAGLKLGESYSHKFDTAGTYNYKCSLHPFMTGKITVK